MVQSTQAVQPQIVPKEAAKPGEPVVKETVKPGDKTKEAAESGDRGKAKQEAKQVTKNQGVKCPPEKKQAFRAKTERGYQVTPAGGT